MIVTVTLNPSVDRTLYVDHVRVGDTNRVLRTETDAGGKGVNLARVAREMGAETWATGFLGGGPGAFVRTVLDREKVPHGFLDVPGETRINVAIEVDDGSAPPTTFNERGPILYEDEWEAMLQLCQSKAPQAKWACLGGSLPPGIPNDAFKTLAQIFKASGCRVVLDADGDPFKQGFQATPDIVKPNAHEAERFFQMPVRTKFQCLDAAKRLYDAGVAIAIVSRGAAGAAMVCSEGSYDALPPTIHAKSTIGSGDSLLGAVLWALDSGKGVVEAFAWGIAAGAATAMTTGAEIGRKPAVEKLLPHVRIERQRSET